MLMGATASAQWEHTGPFGAWTNCHLQVNGQELVGGVAGIFKSTDGASTWFPLGSGLPAGGIQALHYDGTVLYAGVDQEGLFRSLDEGQTWSACNNMALGSPFEITALSQDGSDLLVSCNTGRFRSSDQGLSFAELGDPLDYPGAMIALGGGVTITRSGFNYPGLLHRSNDGGATWSPSTTGLPAIPEIGALHVFGNALYAFGKHVYRSDDLGLTWQQQTTTPALYAPQFSCRKGNSIFLSTGGNFGVVVNRWDFGATTHTSITSGLPDTWTTVLFAVGDEVLINKNGTLYRTVDNGATWAEDPSTGMVGVAAVSVLAEGSLVLCGAGEAIYRSTDAGSNWQRVASPAFTAVIAFYKNGSTVLAGTGGEGLLRSDDGGASWPGLALSGQHVGCFAEGGGALFAGGSSGSSATVARSTNTGSTWGAFSTGLPGQAVVLDLLVVGGTVYAGVGASTGADAGVYSSSTAAAAWTHLPNGIADLAGTALALHDGELHVGTENGVHRSSDQGSSWTAVGSALNGVRVNDLAVVGAHLVAATESGIFLLAPGANDWQDITDDLQAAEPVALAAGSGFLFAATDGRSVARRALITVGMAEPPAGSGIIVAPNPVLDHVRLVGVTVPPGAPVIIHDASGREVLRLRASGGGLDVTGLAPGFYTLSFPSEAPGTNLRFIKH